MSNDELVESIGSIEAQTVVFELDDEAVFNTALATCQMSIT